MIYPEIKHWNYCFVKVILILLCSLNYTVHLLLTWCNKSFSYVVFFSFVCNSFSLFLFFFFLNRYYHIYFIFPSPGPPRLAFTTSFARSFMIFLSVENIIKLSCFVYVFWKISQLQLHSSSISIDITFHGIRLETIKAASSWGEVAKSFLY